MVKKLGVTYLVKVLKEQEFLHNLFSQHLGEK